jgi:hypothetical protein
VARCSIDEKHAGFILDHVAICPGMFGCWRNPALACRLRIVNRCCPSPEHEVRCKPASALHSPAIVLRRQAFLDQLSLIVRWGVHSPCLIEKLARTSHANICFIALGFLGDVLACMVA